MSGDDAHDVRMPRMIEDRVVATLAALEPVYRIVTFDVALPTNASRAFQALLELFSAGQDSPDRPSAVDQLLEVALGGGADDSGVVRHEGRRTGDPPAVGERGVAGEALGRCRRIQAADKTRSRGTSAATATDSQSTSPVSQSSFVIRWSCMRANAPCFSAQIAARAASAERSERGT